ncbi:hypothetical protein H2200_005988 [Cladophialophora chaetospira]|uniref:Uncharacterized protein n=1 Tax=Cladophialophora chaetospira TaxID=386627 RepID=A0AA39CIU8_9EURO|nr:hypothetical protein H2200_005988 [Cladophialophora chaetospira]
MTLHHSSPKSALHQSQLKQTLGWLSSISNLELLPTVALLLSFPDPGEDSSTGAMVDFPPELRYAVVKVLVAELEHYGKWRDETEQWKTLLTLRCTAREFTNMHIIKATLFECIALEATKRDVDRVREMKFVSLASFVKKVILRPSPHNTDLSESDFRMIICNEEREDPMEESMLVENYKTKSVLASHDEFLTQSGELERAWRALLGQFHQLDTISIKSWIGDHPLLSEYSYSYVIDDVVRPTLRKASQTTYSRFFSKVVRCISALQVDVRALEIDYENIQPFYDWSGDDWQQLKLDSLKRICFHAPYMKDLAPDMYQREDNIAEGMDAIMSKISSPLEEIDFRQVLHRSDMKPSFRIRGLPTLRKMALQYLSLDLDEFVSAVAEMPKLELIWLSDICVHYSQDPNSSWKGLFDVIRDQKTSKLVLLDWTDVWSRDDYLQDLYLNLDPACFNEQLSSCQRSGEPELSLLLYVTGRGSWNEELQKKYDA